MAIARVTKPIDSKNRIILPKEVLELVDIKVGDRVYFEVSKTKAIIIRKYEPKKVEEDER